MPKFIPRQRKHKVLAREKAQQNGAKDDPRTDTNIQEIVPPDLEAKKAELRLELRKDGAKVSGKKAKRLEKFIEKKLRKDENRELLAKLEAQTVDTSLLDSTSRLGQARETKREALSRALRQQDVGLQLDDEQTELLYGHRAEPDSEPEPEQVDVGGAIHQQEDGQEPGLSDAPVAPPVSAIAVAGSGLKRPLELDDSGKPILRKRQKRGGVVSKASFVQETARDEESDNEWAGFSDSGSEAMGIVNGDGERSDTVISSEDQEDTDEPDEPGDGSSDSAEYSDSGSEDNNLDPNQRSSAFKAWAHQQRNQALNYEAAGPTLEILNIPKLEGFKPRPIEADPLPMELQPTPNDGRKAYSVAVSRTPEIQSARLQLPIVAEEQRIMEAIHSYDVVVICGSTGSGKTTQVPQFLFEAGYGSSSSPTPGMIGVTQPRRVAAVSMSKRVSQELGDHSHSVAYQIRFEGTVDPNTAIKFMTDGVLLREVAQDITLSKYSAIIIDEAHERSTNTDILVGMLSRVVNLTKELAEENPKVKPLKLVIMSATLRIEDMTQNPTLFSSPPPVIDIEGRQHPVTMHFARKTHHDYVEEAFRKISRGHRKLPPGGFLVFLTGQNEIVHLSKRLRSAFGGLSPANGPKVHISATEAPLEAEDVDFGEFDDRLANEFDEEEADSGGEGDDAEDADSDFEIPDEEHETGPARMRVLPLYSLLPTAEQLKVFDEPPAGHRQVILATNVAETSLTIPGIRYVFDCGRAKERRYDETTGVQSFEIGWISKASANQRAGRAGRTGPGHCYRLYSSAVYERDLPEFTAPEVLRTPIEGVVLQLKAMNLQHVVNFPFPTPPDRHSLAKAEKVLTYLSALSSSGQVTRVGTTMALFPLAPRFARILLVGHLHDCLPYTITLVAALSVAEIFIPENQAIPALPDRGDGHDAPLRSNADIVAETRQADLQRAYNAAHHDFCALDDRSDAIKLLQAAGQFAHEPTEAWCAEHFVRFKALREVQQLRRQIAALLRANFATFAGLAFQDQLDPPSPKQVQALKQMVAAGFVDQVAIRADKAPNPPEVVRKPRRAIDVPYLPLSPLEGEDGDNTTGAGMVYIHPSSPLAHLSVAECPEYVIYARLQRPAAAVTEVAEKRPKTRMHALTDVTGAQLAVLAKGTPLIGYGKPIKEIKGAETESGAVRECFVVPYLRSENGGGMGWPLPARRVKQRKVPGKGWVVE